MLLAIQTNHMTDAQDLVTPPMLKIGITEAGITNTSADPAIDIDTKFHMVKESSAYDYYDKTPESIDVVDSYLAASEKYDLPILAGGWFYRLGQDEHLLKEKLELSARVGSKVHNTQILWKHKQGHVVTDAEVEDIYLRAYEWGSSVGCLPTFEVHISMWSEDFRRVAAVGKRIEQRGIPFRITLDHSHVIFKIDNPEEQAVFDIDNAINNGDLILDPFASGNVCSEWIENGWVQHAHARAAIPNNPKNTAAKHANGKYGRGVQYPFIEPEPNEYIAPWDESKLEPWKEVVRQLFVYHATTPNSPLGQISTEFIPGVDYGAGHGYSIFDNSVACAQWMRSLWQDINRRSNQ